MSALGSPEISLVIPAWNEAASLPRLLDTVAAARNRYRNELKEYARRYWYEGQW